MNKQEQLQELRGTLTSVRKLVDTNTKEVYEKQLLPIAQGCCDNGFVLKVSNGWSCDEYINLTFDLGDWEKEFGLDFTIRLNAYKMIDISHGSLSGDTRPIRKYLIQRDKIIGRLWDKETELLGVFEAVRQERNKTYDLIDEIQRKVWRLEDKIKQEETDRALKELVAGSKWYYKWDNKTEKTPLVIKKITSKLVFTNDYPYSFGERRFKIYDIVRKVNDGILIKFEGEGDK